MAEKGFPTEILMALTPDERQALVWSVKTKCKECEHESEQKLPIHVAEDDLKSKMMLMQCDKCGKDTLHAPIEYHIDVMITEMSSTAKAISFFVPFKDFLTASNWKKKWENICKEKGYRFKGPRNILTWEIMFSTMFDEAQKWDEVTLLAKLKELGLIEGDGEPAEQEDKTLLL